MQLANLDMDVLRTLAVAMELGGFAKAADRLGRSQSAVSLQMRKLEERVGRPLFRRQGRGVALTDAGDVVLSYARRIVELNDQALAAARGVSIAGSVRFGVPQDFGDSWLPPVLARFTRTHPAVLIEARVDRTNKLAERIAEGGLDLALLWGNPPLPNTVTVLRLPMLWIGRKGDAYAASEEMPLALFESPCVFRQPGIEALERARRSWRLAFTSPSLSGLWAAAAAGLGVTIRTAFGLPAPLAALGRASRLPKLPQTALSLYTAQAEPPPAVARLREILLDELRPLAGGLPLNA
jgi:DNA-binding transcriptional LysR family regulator